MYTLPEKKVNEFLCEATSLLDKLSHVNTNIIPTEQIKHFGNSLLEIQTEVHRQTKVYDVGFGTQRLEA